MKFPGKQLELEALIWTPKTNTFSRFWMLVLNTQMHVLHLECLHRQGIRKRICSGEIQGGDKTQWYIDRVKEEQ